MEYIYSAMLLHSAGKEINEANVEKVLSAAGVSPDKARIKALVAALEGVDIEEAISKATVLPAAAPAPAPEEAEAKPAGEEKKEEKKEEEKEVSEEEAASGLSALFG